MATSAVRLDARLRPELKPVVWIAEEVFGAPPGTGGPPWILDPGPLVQKRFWERFGPRIEPHQPVFTAAGKVLAEAVRDVHERSLPAFAELAGAAALFFIDLLPEANWAHPCAYVLMAAEDEAVWAEDRWPPSDSISLVRLRRPPASPLR